MGDLASKLVPLGLLPQVVPEFRDMTCAGLLNGQGIQTSSHRYGLFTDTVVGVQVGKFSVRSKCIVVDRNIAAQVVLGDGTVMDCSDQQNPDVLEALRNATHGTLFVVTAVALKLMDAQKWIK